MDRKKSANHAWRSAEIADGREMPRMEFFNVIKNLFRRQVLHFFGYNI